ncbi:hypothetical protein ACFHW0_28540 [Micromonospora sp. LOL_025]|uniref:AraC-like ligand-binding domain-containing protein n=1 Tax=Micromonospora sp. LOL_025 TaxID=3345413 RepID=UPI003A86FCB5
MLPCQVLDTSLFPPRDRFACWYEVIESEAAPTRISSPHLDDFVAQAKSVDLGNVKLAGLRYPTLDTTRTSKLVRTSQPDNYQFVLTTAGDSAISQDRNHSAVEPASFTFLDNCRPFAGRHRSTGQGLAGSISVVIPHKTLPLPAERPDGCSPRRFRPTRAWPRCWPSSYVESSRIRSSTRPPTPPSWAR